MLLNNFTIIFTDESPFDGRYKKRRMWRDVKNHKFMREIEYGKANIGNNLL